MKFGQLEIHNINSIADAVIDFERLMPVDQHIFMIWGPSGAGKSTVLDAICMALFCKTPRLQSIAEKKENQYQDPEFQFSDRDKGIAINDLRQYLKRGTKEGYCSLKFVGNDSITYTAKTAFSINRNGNLNNIEWTLTSKNGVLNKVKEVEQQVITITGLTYEQFCRTTMLAQGEFTKFMKSDQNAKAEILEKLTDTSVFSEIGRRIYEKYSKKNRDLDQLNRENESIVRFDDGQITEYQDNIRLIKDENKQLESELNILNQKANWIKHLAVLQEDKYQSEKLWQEANTRLNSKENIQDRQLISQWEQTEAERSALLDLRKLRQNALEIAQLEEDYKIQYQQLTAGYLSLKATIAQAEASKMRLQGILDAQQYKSETFANAQSLSEKLKQFAQFGQNIDKNQKKYRQNEQALLVLETNLNKQQAAISQKQTAIEKWDAKLKVLKEEAKLFDLGQLTALLGQQKDRLRDLNEANKSVQMLKNQQNEIKELKQTLVDKRQLMETLTAQKHREEVEYANALSTQETAQNVYDSAAKSVHEFAKQVRASLKIGDICPVCGQKVAQLLTNEAAEESLLKLKSVLDEAKKAVSQARKQLDEAITGYQTEEGNIKSLKRDLENKTSKQKNDLAALEQLCQNLQILVNDTIQDQINQQLVDNEKIKKEIEDKIAVSNTLNQQIEKANEEAGKEKKQQEDLRISCHDVELQKAKLQEENNALLAHSQDDIKQQSALQSELSGFFAATYPEWAENPTGTARNLTDEAGAYAKSLEEISNVQASEEKLRDEQRQIERSQQQLKSLFDWPLTDKSQPVDRLVEKWADFVTKCTVLSQNMAETRGNIAQKETFLQSFYSEHPDIQEDRLTRLANTSIEAISQLREQQALALNQEKTANGQYLKAQESLQKHQKSKPDFEEGEDLDKIEVVIAEKNRLKTEKLQQIGQIGQILQQDADNKRKYADTLLKLKTLGQEVRQWERLNNIYGDKAGKTFRKIAQSFILQKLLDNTNYFLGMLSDRYELTGAGRELMILVKDKYLGDAPRPVEMVSGGESFLISIALALGLSNLALQGISSDFLFIDEGISQLDGTLCDSVVNTLQQLHHIVHCNIGIVSHLDVLAEKIPTKIIVQPISHGTSSVSS